MLNLSQGSLEELRDYLLPADDFGYAGDPTVAGDLDDVARLLDENRRKHPASIH
jgi:hypothetical protein